MLNPMASTAEKLLADKTYDIEFRGYLSNHAKHAIVALDRLQAPSSRVQGYWDEYTHMTPYNIQLHKVDQAWDDVEPVSQEEWKQLHGKKQKWQEQVAFMERELKEMDENTDALIQKFAPDLLPGVAGSLTHGIIHLGWGIDAGSPWMICEGLAYLNFCSVEVGPDLTPDSHEEATPMESLERVSKAWDSENLSENWVANCKDAFNESFHPELIPAGFQWELAKVLERAHGVATELPTWINKPVDEVFKALYHSTVWLYLATRDEAGNGNFLVLHLITSLWALEQTCRVIDKTDVTREALGHYYAVLVCLFAASGVGVLPASTITKIQQDYPIFQQDKPDLNWSTVVDKAIHQEEEHNIKLVYVLKELWKRYDHWHGFSVAADAFTLTPNIGPDTPVYDA